MGLLRRAIRFLGADRTARAGDAAATAVPVTADQRDTGDAGAAELYEKALHYLDRDDPVAAEPLLEQCISIRHDFADAHFVLGQIHQRRGQLDDANDCYLLAAHFRPDLQAAHLKLGLLALDGGRFPTAVEHLERAVAVGADDAKARNALGAALLKLRRTEESVAQLRRALELDPNLAEAHNNLGYVLFREFEQFDAGARHLERALELAPDNEGVLCTWTMVLQQQGRFDELLQLAERLLARNPGLHEVRLNRGLVLLTRGEFERGWRDYEARKFLPPYVQHDRRPPEWGGESLANRKLLVYSEQGIGDEIMFASCLPDVLRMARQCVVECSPKLETLFRRSFASASIFANTGGSIASGAEIPVGGVDVLTAMGSLPRFLRNSIDDFPVHDGYLTADAGRIAHWQSCLDRLGPGIKVGIAWRGGVQSTRRSLRSIPLEEWLPLLRCDGATFISLQHTNAVEDLKHLQTHHGIAIHHWPDAIDVFDETAALICALDLVITVQTAVAHLSGALAKPAWVMLSHVPEWRYTARGETMPWYPSVRLFRQPAPGDWGSVINAISGRLTDFRAARTRSVRNEKGRKQDGV